MTEAIEKAALAAEAFAAIQESNPGGNEDYWEDLARAVLSTTREPSEAEVEAAYNAFHAAYSHDSGRAAIRAALIAAAGARTGE